MSEYHTSKQNIVKLRGLIQAVRSLDTLKASTNNVILRSTIENAVMVADQSEGALNALELVLSDHPVFVIKNKTI